jgi:phosphoglycerol transferase MdoB-like AlkP superfamily enzyme
MTTRAPSRLGVLARRAGTYLLLGALVALLAELVLEAARTGWDWTYLAGFVAREVGVVAVGALVLFLVVLAVLAATGRVWVTAALVLSMTTLLGVASQIKFGARREPIYPRDLMFALEPRFLLEMVEPPVVWLILLTLAVLTVSAWALSRLLSRRRPSPAVGRPSPRQRFGVLTVRLGLVGLSLFLLSSLLHFHDRGNMWREGFEAAGAHWRRASQAGNYNTNGFVGGFLYNLDVPTMLKPPGYSAATMAAIVAEYTAAAERRYGDRDPQALRDVSVVSVLSESFSDPTRLRGISLAEDPIPRIRALMGRLPHGSMLTQKVGGGTSSMEFEELTGMSLSQFDPTMDTPYQMLVPEYREFPSVVAQFNRLGHTTVAIHPYYPTLYQRSRVYPALGFSEFRSQEDLASDERLEDNPFISDKAAFDETLAALREHDEPLFVHLVTMQNHAPYAGKYADPIGVEGVTGEDAETVGNYARGLTYTDDAVSDFLRDIGRSDEKTVVLFYGDHLPARLPETVYRNNPARKRHETPFFLYANFGRMEPERLPTTSPIFFMPRVFELAGAPLPPYYALLRALESRVPALSHAMMIGPDNRRVGAEDLSPEAREILRDYRLVQYDLSVGRRYAEEMLYPPTPTTLGASGTRR